MPFLNVKTNVPVDAAAAERIKTQLGRDIAVLPGKSEAWLMVGIEPEYRLWFKGTDAPAALVEASVFGEVDASSAALTAKICALLEKELGIPQDRTYVRYSAHENWGWNGSNF